MTAPQKEDKITRSFSRAANKVSNIVGSPYWFFFSVLMVILWIPTGFIVGWGEIWHLLINTTTTIMTFLMMALLHASQSKWEDRMERLQIIEQSKIDDISRRTEQPHEQISSLT